MPDLFCDTETFNEQPLSNGSYKYAETAEVMLFQWALDDDPVQIWDRTTGAPMPPDLAAYLAHPEVLVWMQNGDKFDWPVINHALPEIYSMVPMARRRDTMVQAYAHSLPGGLDMMGAVLGLKEDAKKIKDGKRLVQLFCKPQSEAFFNKFGTYRATKFTHPEEWQRFLEYAGRDIVTMRAAHRKMPMWNYRGKQVELWHIDQRINNRGICIDLDLCRAAVRASDIHKKQLAQRTSELTEGAVDAATQRDEMLAHILEQYGVTLPDMQKDTIERRAQDENLPEELRELLRVRLMATTSSVAKYKTVLKSVNSDGRVRGTMQWRGAMRTGRVGHRLVQPGNMPRPDMKAHEIEWAIDLLKKDAAHLVYDNVMKVCSNAIRGMIVSPPGKSLFVSDLSNIEGRFAAWLAGEDWKLQAFRDFDAIIPGEFDAKGKPKRKGADLYLVAYANSFNVPVESIDLSTIEGYNQRQIGKVEELMFQYGGGVGAWITGAATYSIDLPQMTEQVWDTLPEWAKKEATDFLEWLYQQAIGTKLPERLAEIERKLESDETQDIGTLIQQGREIAETIEKRKLKARLGLSEKTFIACDSIKRLWRKAHPAISSYWRELEDAIKYCIAYPGEQIKCRKLKIRYDPGWLRIGLPSGRVLCYPNAGINVTVTLPNGTKKNYPGISYMGIDAYTKQWQRISTYGGKVFENVTQAGSADQLFECMPAIEAEGFEIVLDVHDEFVTEASNDTHKIERLNELLCSDHGWNEGLPLAAAGYVAPRYKKD